MVWPSNSKRRGRTAPIADKNNNAGTERRQPRSDDEVWRSQLEEVDQLASSTISSPGKHIQKNQNFDSHQPLDTPLQRSVPARNVSKQRYQSPSEPDLPTTSLSCPTNPPTTTTTHGPIPPATTCALPKASRTSIYSPPPITPSTNNPTPQTHGN